jgi:hypothetical protein
MPIDFGGGGASGGVVGFAHPASASGSSIVIHFILTPSIDQRRDEGPDSSRFLHFNYTFAP